jgi:hypothetical protein
MTPVRKPYVSGLLRERRDDIRRAMDATESPPDAELRDQIKAVASNLGTVGDRYLEACRKDLQGEAA